MGRETVPPALERLKAAEEAAKEALRLVTGGFQDAQAEIRQLKALNQQLWSKASMDSRDTRCPSENGSEPERFEMEMPSTPAPLPCKTGSPGLPHQVRDATFVENFDEEGECVQAFQEEEEKVSSMPPRPDSNERPKSLYGRSDSQNFILSAQQSSQDLFEVLPFYAQEQSRSSANGSQRHQSESNRGHTQMVDSDFGHQHTVDFGDLVEEKTPYGQAYEKMMEWFNWMMMNPQSTKRTLWSLASLVIIVYDCFALPMQVFDPPPNIFADVMSWVTRIFWTMDFPVSFFTGFMKADGTIEMRLKVVWLTYIKTWMAFDLFLNLIEWMSVVFEGSVSFFSKAGRSFRMIRMIRLLRVARLRQVVVSIIERIQSEKVMVAAEIVKIMICIVGVAHLVACSWFWVGSGDQGWVQADAWDEAQISYQYTTSLHWSLSQLVGGMDEVVPKNTQERSFTIMVFLFGFIVAAVFISNITSSLTRLDMITSRQQTQASVLRRYLAQNGVSVRLMQRLHRNASHALSEREKVMNESEVELIGMISESLRIELHYEIYFPCIHTQEFFKTYSLECPHVVRYICHRAITVSYFALNDLIFCDGERSLEPKMYIVKSGTIKYTTADRISEDGQDVSKGAVIAEAALWTTWVHRGLCKAKTDCSLYSISTSTFTTIVGQFSHPNFSPSTYAMAYVDDLNTFKDLVNDITTMQELAERTGQISSVAEGYWRMAAGPGRGSEARSSLSSIAFRSSRNSIRPSGKWL